MKYYRVHITLNTGDEIHANTRAQGNAQAVESILKNPQFIEFCKGATITKVDVKQTTETPPDYNRFAISRTGDQITALDLDTKVKVIFKVGDYNNNRVERLGNADQNPDPLTVANGLRVLADWLQETHPDLI